ncbi:MAG: HDOD domain-containing protein [Planctomycetota bacterium]|jgi:HD-like signal output (HDOD) protein
MTVAEEIVQAVDRVPPLSQSAMQLMSLVADESHSLNDLVPIVSADSGLTAAVFKVVNSAAFGLNSEITSISRAIGYLGDKVTVGLALGLCASGVYNNPLDGYEGEAGELWHHSLRTAIGARELSKFTGGCVSQEDAYSAGILHDIGKSVISAFMKGDTEELVKASDREECPDFRQAEFERYGTDHCAVGSVLAEHWKLPAIFHAVIAYHHYPEQAAEELKPLTFVLHVADNLAMLSGVGTGADCLLYPFNSNYTEYIEITQKELEALMVSVAVEYEKTAEALLTGTGIGGEG